MTVIVLVISLDYISAPAIYIYLYLPLVRTSLANPSNPEPYHSFPYATLLDTELYSQSYLLPLLPCYLPKYNLRYRNCPRSYFPKNLLFFTKL
jgi:hypothetical protein